MTDTMRVAFRADSSSQMGSGHLMRCLTLADALRDRGAESLFVAREHSGHLIRRIEEAGHAVRRLPTPPKRRAASSNSYAAWLGVSQAQDAAETLETLGQPSHDWLVVDHYGLDAKWERTLRPSAERILVIDDLADRYHECDSLLDQGYYGAETEYRYEGLMPDSSRRLLGPRYALLHADFARVRTGRGAREYELRRVLVFFGGSDPTDQTSRALTALSGLEMAHLLVDVVIGPNHPDPEGIARRVAERPGTTLFGDLPTLADLMGRADLGLGAGGMTTWERSCLGLPSLVAVVAENQASSARAMAKDGRHVLVAGGGTPTVDDWRAALVRAVRDPAALATMGQRASEVTDGLGAKRVACAMLGRSGLRLAVRPATRADEPLLFDWASDLESREQGIGGERITSDEFARWFGAKLADKNTLILVGEDQSALPLGQVRFDMDRARGEALIAISVDRCLRDGRVVDELLSRALAHLRGVEPGMQPVADVRDANIRCPNLLTRLGVTQRHSAPDHREGAIVGELAS